MSKPAKYPEWASDAQTDPISGQANIVEPPDERKTTGFQYREKPPRNWLNWLLNTIYQWIVWLEQPDRTRHLGAAAATSDSTSTWYQVPAYWVHSGACANDYLFFGLPLELGERITAVRLRCQHSTGTAGAITAQLIRNAAGSNTASTDTASAASTGDQTISLAGITADNVVAGESYTVVVNGTADSMFRYVLSLEYDTTFDAVTSPA